jgi:hypothetical protein
MVRMLCIFGIVKQSQGLTTLLKIPSMGESNMDDVQDSVQRQRRNHSILTTSTLIILISEMLRFSPQKKFLKKNREILRIFFFLHKIFKIKKKKSSDTEMLNMPWYYRRWIASPFDRYWLSAFVTWMCCSFSQAILQAIHHFTIMVCLVS